MKCTVKPALMATSLTRPFFWCTVHTFTLVSTSQQWPLSSVPKVAIVERFNCLQSCALTLVPNFCCWGTRKPWLFHNNLMLGTLEFTGSVHLDPFSLSQSTSLNIMSQQPNLHSFIHLHIAGPLPMRMRALPQSFWQEPKDIQNSSLSTEGTLQTLPPLFHNANNTSYDVSKVRPVTPPEEKLLPRPPKEPKLVYTSPQEQLLKLFETVEEDKTKKFVIRRGR